MTKARTVHRMPNDAPEARPADRERKTPALERRRGRPRADARDSLDEAQLLRTAFARFAASGYEAATMRAMARELNVSHNLLNVRFGRKSELWKAAVDWRLREASQSVELAFAADGTAEERLRDLVRRFCRWALDNSDIVTISHQEGQQESWRLDYILQQFAMPFQRRLQRLLAEAADSSVIFPISSGALLALLVHGVGSYFALRPMHDALLQDGDKPPSLVEQAASMADFLLAGVFATPTPKGDPLQG